MENKSHVVYGAFDCFGKCLYVGQGIPGRENHIVSGISHVIEANSWYFNRLKLDVKIINEGLTKEQAVVEEQKLMLELLPTWNKAIGNTPTPFARTVAKQQYRLLAGSGWERTNNKIQHTFAKKVINSLGFAGESLICQNDLFCGNVGESKNFGVGRLSDVCNRHKYKQVVTIFDVTKYHDTPYYCFKLKDFNINDHMGNIVVGGWSK